MAAFQQRLTVAGPLVLEPLDEELLELDGVLVLRDPPEELLGVELLLGSGQTMLLVPPVTGTTGIVPAMGVPVVDIIGVLVPPVTGTTGVVPAICVLVPDSIGVLVPLPVTGTNGVLVPSAEPPREEVAVPEPNAEVPELEMVGVPEPPRAEVPEPEIVSVPKPVTGSAGVSVGLLGVAEAQAERIKANAINIENMNLFFIDPPFFMLLI